MRRRRAWLVLLAVVAALALGLPSIAERARVRWLAWRLRSSDVGVRGAAVRAILERPAVLDELYSEVVATAIAEWAAHDACVLRCSGSTGFAGGGMRRVTGVLASSSTPEASVGRTLQLRGFPEGDGAALWRGPAPAGGDPHPYPCDLLVVLLRFPEQTTAGGVRARWFPPGNREESLYASPLVVSLDGRGAGEILDAVTRRLEKR